MIDGTITGGGNFDRITSDVKDLTITYGTLSMTMNGTQTQVTDPITDDITLYQNMNVEHGSGEKYQMKMTYEITQIGNTLSFSTELHGKLISDRYGYVEVTTIEPIIDNDGELTPAEGQLHFAGSNGSQMKLTYVMDGYTLDIDEDGNGEYETNKSCGYLDGCITSSI